MMKEKKKIGHCIEGIINLIAHSKMDNPMCFYMSKRGNQQKGKKIKNKA